MCYYVTNECRIAFTNSTYAWIQLSGDKNVIQYGNSYKAKNLLLN